MHKLPPLINKGKLKLASEIELGDHIILDQTDLFSVGEVIEIHKPFDENSPITIKTQNGMTFLKKDFKPDHSFPVYETYHQKG